MTVYSAIGALIIGTVLAGDAVVAGAGAELVGYGLRQHRAQHAVDADHPVLLARPCLRPCRSRLASDDSPTFIDDSNFRLAVLGLAVYTASFVCETLRSGVNTIPLGQAEAARSLGLTFGQNLTTILLPQAFRATIIPMGSVLIALTKNTTIASVIGVGEAALLMSEWVENVVGAAADRAPSSRPGSWC